MRLNPEQEAAVHAKGHCVVLACPGSGKTRVLVERSAKLAKENPDSQQVLVTFTRQAAGELGRRLEKKLVDLARVRIATFHALALQQVILNDQTRICSPSEQLVLQRLAAQAHLPDKDFMRFRSAVDSYTSGNLSALDCSAFQLAYESYLELLAEHSAIDFGQALLRAVKGMRAGTIKPYPCDYLLVDEVQDIDPTQVRWVREHTDAGATLMIVGDDDQSIYGFRSALGIRGMRYLGEAHSASEVFLSTNYRSHVEILGLAMSLIGQNAERVAKDLRSAKGAGGSVKLHSRYWKDLDEDEAIVNHLRSSEKPWAVIARTNRKLDRIGHALRTLKVPFVRPGRTRFWDTEIPSLFLRLLDAHALRDRLTLAAARLRCAPSSDKSKTEPEGIRILRRALKRDSGRAGAQECIDAVADWLSNHVNGIAPDRLAQQRRLIQHCRQYLSDMDGSLSARLQQARRPASDDEERITLLTMHGAKGMEFDSVWIAGCQDGVIPSKRSDDIEEERRLLYVAMTRAERCLHISFAWNQEITPEERQPYLKRLTPSRFLTADLKIPIPGRDQVKRAA